MSGTLGKQGEVLIAGFQIPLRHLQQHHPNACWATCLAMIFAWRGMGEDQHTIFTKAPTLNSEYRYGDMAAPNEVKFFSKKLSDTVVTFSDIPKETLSRATDDEWIAVLNRFKPVLFVATNHLRILMGYNGVGHLLFLDPAAPAGSQPGLTNAAWLRVNGTAALVMD